MSHPPNDHTQSISHHLAGLSCSALGDIAETSWASSRHVFEVVIKMRETAKLLSCEVQKR